MAGTSRTRVTEEAPRGAPSPALAGVEAMLKNAVVLTAARIRREAEDLQGLPSEGSLPNGLSLALALERLPHGHISIYEVRGRRRSCR